MPTSAASASIANHHRHHHRTNELIDRLSSTAYDTKLKALRDLKNQIIGNRTKKLSFLKLGVVPTLVSFLSSHDHDDADSLLIQSAAAIGSFSCGFDAGVHAVLDAGAFPHLFRLISHPNCKVVDACARSLRMIYQSKLAPKYDFFKEKNMEFLISLLDSENENVTGLGASIVVHSCETSTEQKALSDSGVLKKLINLLGGSLSQRDASLESLATIMRGNLDVISRFMGPEGRGALNVVTELIKDKYPRTRLLSCIFLIVLGDTCPCHLQDEGTKRELMLILLELLDDVSRVGDDAALALSSFFVEKEDLHQLAFEEKVVDELCKKLEKCSLQIKRCQGILLTLADLCSKLECCRSRVLSLKAMNFVTDALNNSSAEVRVAACVCLRNVSRSVKNLSAGCFMNETTVTHLVQLLDDTSAPVKIEALRVISNIVVDFKMHNSIFVQCGGVKHLLELAKSMDSAVRLNAVWALRNFLFLADNKCKEGIFSELTALTASSLVCDAEVSVQEQALALVRNLVDGPMNSAEFVFAEDGLLLNAIGKQLHNASKNEVLIQGMYVLSNVASGNEFQKEAVMNQLFPQPECDNQSILVKFLRSNNKELRTATVWTLVNLTIPNSPGVDGRAVKFRNAGIVSQLKDMVNDPCLDVKLRVRTALEQCIPSVDGYV